MIWGSQHCPAHSATLVLSLDTWLVSLSCASPATVLIDRQGSPRTVGAHGVLSFSAISGSILKMFMQKVAPLGQVGFVHFQNEVQQKFVLDGTSFIYP